jgi:predicted chitinase
LTRCNEVAKLINKYADEYGLTSNERLSHFIGQIGAESNLFALKEDYKYSSKARIKEIFGKKELVKYCDLYVGYSSNWDECDGNKPSQCSPNLKEILPELVIKDKFINSKLLFDYTYSCRLGNGTPNSGDGSRFRGRAFLHLTGRKKYATLESNWNKTFPDNKKDFTCESDECESTRELLVTDLNFAMKSSLAFWSSVNANDDANTVTKKSIEDVSTKVNGGSNGIKTRKEITEKAYNILKK